MKRATEPEIIDLGPSHYTSEEYEDCLYQLDRVGRLLGGDQANYWALKQLGENPLSILDVGCGGGLFSMRLAERYPKSQVLGIDTSPEAIQFANAKRLKRHPQTLSNIEFGLSSGKLDYPPKSFDVIMSTLVCHHLTDDDIVDFLTRAYSTATRGIIINDLHRHIGAIIGFGGLAPLLFRNRLVYHDGPLSIRRAFKRKDWIAYINAAGIPLDRCSITWHWAFRWIVLIRGY